MNDDVKDVIREASKTTEAIGRRMRSPKTGVEDLSILIEGLEHVAQTLRILERVELERICNVEV